MKDETKFYPETADVFDNLKKLVEERLPTQPFDYNERMKILSQIKQLSITKEQISDLKRVVRAKTFSDSVTEIGIPMTDAQLEWQKLFFNLGLYEQTVFDEVTFNEVYQ